jgi:dTDP-4-amino-4,6-dideoxygalactose transaminase
MIPVTKTFLPPMEEYQKILQKAWDKQWITNRGDLILELEDKLKTYLNVELLTIMTNGTLPLQIAIKALALEGEIITTPFSYVATTASIVWENCKPVFVDIHPDYLTMDASKIEAAITNKTSAILATHVFGNPCEVESIDEIAKKYNLKVIYDAAHCFAVKHNGQSVFNYGDVSTCSFHATKLFHTGEGGAIFCNDENLHKKLFYHHNFGHNGPLDFHGLGINAKISELQAAMGLAVFPYLPEIIKERKRITDRYFSALQNKKIGLLKLRESCEWNYSYFPVIFQNEAQLLRVIEKMAREEIVPRRYFYPSLNTVQYCLQPGMEVAEKIAKTVLCLPLYYGLTDTEIDKIIELVLSEI